MSKKNKRSVFKESFFFTLVFAFFTYTSLFAQKSPAVTIYHNEHGVFHGTNWLGENGLVLKFDNGIFYEVAFSPNSASGIIYGVDKNVDNNTYKVFIPNGRVMNNVDCLDGCDALISGQLYPTQSPAPSVWSLIKYKPTEKHELNDKVTSSESSANMTHSESPMANKRVINSFIFYDLQPINNPQEYEMAGSFPTNDVSLVGSLGEDKLSVKYADGEWIIQGECKCIADKSHNTNFNVKGNFRKYSNDGYPVLISDNLGNFQLNNKPGTAVFFKNPITKKWELVAQNGEKGTCFIEK
ncbi:MAG: hypothetical protein QM528_04940 [Phycisphaerales bacterium]|nr:hypothetical protein [Phycisphaerales bacterium]